MLTRNAYLTRLTSTISPSEMTVDPVFGFNPDLGDVSNYHEATLAFDCEGGDPVLRLEGGYDLPVDDLTPEAMPTPTWVDAHLKHKALVIEQLSESGPGDVLVDHRDDLAAPPAPDEGSFGGGGCACDTSGGGGVGLGLLALAWVRRRRA
jgi:MYXO-CTERM domain-containing protein